MNDKIYTNAYENNLTCFKSESIDINLENSNCDIRQDLLLEEKYLSKIWGYVFDYKNNPVEGTVLSLFKIQYVNKLRKYIKIGTTVSNSDGLYIFELEEIQKNIDYIVNIDKY